MVRSQDTTLKPFPIVLNQSQLKDYNNCQRLWGWRRIENLDVGGKRSALEIGSAVHAGLAAFHAGKTVEEATATVSKMLAERAGTRVTFEDKSLEEASAIAGPLLPAYVEFWKDRGELWAPLNQEVEFLSEVQPGWWYRTFSGKVTDEEGKALEAEWTARPSGIYIRGKSDNLSIIKGALFIVDYKTAGRMDARDLLKYELDMQLSAYIYGISKQLTADSAKDGGPPIKVEGAIIDLLVKTKEPQFAREDFTRSEAEMAEFELEWVEYGKRIRAQLARVAAGEDWKAVFPKNTEHCFRYGTCAFRDLCLKDTPVRRVAYVKREPDYVDSVQQELQEAWRKEMSEGKASPKA